jgi:hypothetical protein
MKKLLLVGTTVLLMATSASAQSSIPRDIRECKSYACGRATVHADGSATVRVGNVVRVYDKDRRLMASGTRRGNTLSMRVVDGTRLKINYRTRRIYDEHGRVIGVAHPDNLR